MYLNGVLEKVISFEHHKRIVPLFQNSWDMYTVRQLNSKNTYDTPKNQNLMLTNVILVEQQRSERFHLLLHFYFVHNGGESSRLL